MARFESLNVGELNVGGSAANGTSIKKIKKYTSGTVTIGAHTGGVAQSTSVTLTGVKATDFVIAAWPTTTKSELIVAQAVVSAADTVLLKTIGGTVNPTDETWEFLIGSL